MIFFDRDRVKIPRSLFDSGRMNDIQRAIDEHMRLPAERRAQTDIPPVWKAPFEPDVLRALVGISDGCCAFCGLERDLSVYRFRPPAYAQPIKPAEQNESYLWLSFKWENLFPICNQCRPLQPSHFPVEGKRAAYSDGKATDEKATLIYPGELSQPYRHFSFSSGGRFIGLTKRAEYTIEFYRLNAPAKNRSRRALIKRLELAIRRAPRNTNVFRESELSDFEEGYLRRVVSKFLERKQQGPLTPRSSVTSRLLRIAAEDNFEANLEAVLADIHAEDAAPGGADGNPEIEALRAARGADHARLARVELETFKSLEQIQFDVASDLAPATQARLAASAATWLSIPDAPCVMILGENATGKSSILEAIALTVMPKEQREQLGVETANMTLDPEYMGMEGKAPSKQSQVEIAFHAEEAKEPAAPRVVSLTIHGGSSAEVPMVEGGDRSQPLPPLFAYGAHRLYGTQSDQSPLRHIETLFHNDRQLPKPETWLATLKKDDLNEVAAALRHIIQIDGDFHTIEVEDVTGRCKINVKKTPPIGDAYFVAQRMDIVSSGYRAVLALVCDVLEGLMTHAGGSVSQARDTPAIVLIDEIEAHLHPRWKLHVVTGLRRALPKVTFIMTSHDPLCVRGMYNGEILALNRYHNTQREGLGMPERVEPVLGFENVEAMTIEQLLTSELFQLLSTDDPEFDHAMAWAADTMVHGHDGPDAGTMEEIQRILVNALPFGQTEMARMVQEAVSEYLVERRGRDHGAQEAARKKAKETIKARLRDLMQ